MRNFSRGFPAIHIIIGIDLFLESEIYYNCKASFRLILQLSIHKQFLHIYGLDKTEKNALLIKSNDVKLRVQASFFTLKKWNLM